MPVNTSNTLRPNLRRLGFTPPFDVVDSALQRARQIDMEQWSVHAMHDCHLCGSPRVRLTVPEILGEFLTAGAGVVMGYRIASADTLRSSVFHVLCPLAFELFFVLVELRCSCGTHVAPDFGNAEDGFPALEG